ncbi:hypothetical protein M885DRAFT_522047 [Pelagophyceae sp. CCMP2097]|nr:hypothetical protein M885DRAFT_522047 [Pelagophyceae sp. CCMP2097]
MAFLWALALVLAVNLAGLHMVWTHLWMLSTILVSLEHAAGAAWLEPWLGSLTCAGLSITVGWYATLVVHRRADFVGRAMAGWGEWTLDVCKAAGVVGAEAVLPYDFTCLPVALRLGYHFCDVAIHFFPTFFLLQKHAVVVAAAPAKYCLAAFCVTRLWSLHVSVHHVKYDVQRRKMRRQTQRPTVFLIDGAFNDVYGLVPPIPPRVVRDAYVFEVGTSALLGCAALAADLLATPLTPRFLQLLGGGALATPTQIAQAATLCAAFGAASVGCALVQIAARIQANGHCKRSLD